MVFLVTTLDSAAYTMASVASRSMSEKQEPARWLRIFFALVLGGVSVGMMAGGGLEPMQNLTIITSVPVLVILMAFSLMKWLQEDETIDTNQARSREQKSA